MLPSHKIPGKNGRLRHVGSAGTAQSGTMMCLDVLLIVLPLLLLVTLFVSIYLGTGFLQGELQVRVISRGVPRPASLATRPTLS